MVIAIVATKKSVEAKNARTKPQSPASPVCFGTSHCQSEVPPAVVHHSDQGIQYARREYLQTLWHHRMLPSMSRPANPYDNATCESFLKTLKREEINANAYRDFEHLSQSVEFIERYYNRCRLHSALRYSSPEKLEKEGRPEFQTASATAKMTFFGG